LIRAVKEDGERPDVPPNTPLSLSSLMKQCWNVAPSMRPPLSSVLSADPFNAAITEAVAEGEGKVKTLWDSFGKGSDGNVKQQVQWIEFQSGFCKMLNLKADQKEKELAALSAILDVTENKDQVSIGDFKRFLSFFKPLRSGGTREPSTLDEVYALCQEKWFWGTLDAKMAEKFLHGGKKGSFLVRFSGKIEGQFTLSYVVKDASKKLSIQHMRVDKLPNESLQNCIKRVNKKMKIMKTPLAGRPVKYESLSRAKTLSGPAHLYRVDEGLGDAGDVEDGGWGETNTLVS
jgi:hypothetical protein